MKIYRGTKFNGTIPCRWIQPRTMWQWDLDDLINGLCSKYWRHRYPDDDPLPDHLTIDEIVDVTKEQYEHYGTNAVWTWTEEGLDEEGSKEAHAWARRLILTVLPDIDVPKETT